MESIKYKDKPSKILVVDDEDNIRYVLTHKLSLMGYDTLEAETATDAINLIESEKPDLVILDIKLPDYSGHAVLNKIRINPATRFLPVIMITGVTEQSEKIDAIQNGVNDFIIKPFDWKELTVRVNSLIQYKLLIDELEEAEKVVVALAKTIDARDSYTAGHSERVSVYAYELGKQIGLPDTDLTTLHRGSLLHDIGKIAIRDEILLKRDDLTEKEYDEIKEHPIVGRDLIQNMKTMDKLLPMIYAHHERIDGSGYPEGISGKNIHIFAQIVSLADVYDALITARVYRPAHPDEKALQIIDEEARSGRFDPYLVKEFLHALNKSENMS